MEIRDYAAQDAVGLAGLLRTGQVSAAEVEDAARRAIESVEPQLSATVGDLLEQPLEASADGPFAGVPFAMKEVAPHLKGQLTQLGSALAGDGVTGAGDTFLGQRFRAAGLRVLARTRSPEFAFNATTEPKLHGPTRNPYDLGRSVGGSSGGAGALVASRALAVAHATDGGGSIRIPASLCGIVGLKPTRERIPVGPGQWEGLHGMAHDFVLCRTLRDCAAMLDVLHGPAPGEKYVIPPPARPYADEVGADPGTVRIGWTAAAWSGEPVDPEVRAATERVAVALAEAGHAVEAGRPELDYEQLHRALLVGWSTGLAQRIAGLEKAKGMAAGPDTVEACSLRMIEYGRSLTAVQLLDGLGDANAVGRAFGAFFEGVDVLLMPSVAQLPWQLGLLDQDDDSLDADGWVRKLFGFYSPFTAMINITGQPTISLPLAWSESGLPIGIQLVGRYGDEATLLRVAAQLEQRFPWADRLPGVHAA